MKKITVSSEMIQRKYLQTHFPNSIKRLHLQNKVLLLLTLLLFDPLDELSGQNIFKNFKLPEDFWPEDTLAPTFHF